MGNEIKTLSVQQKYEEFKRSSILFPNHTRSCYFDGKYFINFVENFQYALTLRTYTVLKR